MPIQKQLVVSYAPVSVFDLGGVPYQGYSYTLSTKNVREKATPKSVAQSAIHYINLFDRSGSMYGEIDDVIDQAQLLFSQIRPQDFWSVIWFSGTGDFKTLLKGAQYNQKLHDLLDTLRSVRGTTCFSESIAESSKIIDELGSIAENVVITLFTDGMPVVSNVSREMNLCRSLVEGMRNKIIAFNTIGFGNYYNREFMQSLSAESEQGRYVHISRIREFEPVYRETAERARDLSQCSLTLTVPGASILYQSGKFVQLREHTLTLDHVDLEDNQITVLVPKGTSLATGRLSVGDEGHHSVSLQANGKVALTQKEVEGLSFKATKPFYASPEVLYGYTCALYADKKSKRAREILVRNLGDKIAADAIASSFTYAEMGETTKRLEEAVVGEGRWMGTCDASYLPKRDAFCVMDVLDALASSSTNKYVPFAYKSPTVGFTPGQLAARELLKPYQRVREKMVDTQNIFEYTEDEVQVPCDDLVYAEDRPNISLRFTVPGYVRLNARAASRVGLPEEYPAKRFQTHTFIKDGNLNMSNAEFILDTPTYDFLVLQNVPHTVLDEDGGRMIIHLEKLPLINEKIMEASLLDRQDLAHNTREMTKQEALQKVLRSEIKRTKETLGLAAEMSEDFSALTEEQIQVLLDHGIDKRSTYGGISRKTEERTENADYYEVRELSLYPVGVSSLPSVNDVQKKIDVKKVLTPREQYIANAMSQVGSLLKGTITGEDALYALETDLAFCKQRLGHLRSQMAAFKIGIVLQADFESFSGLDFNEKGTAEFDGVCLSMKRVKQYV